jgi:3-mercaptopyruvate sulfurtransferase SseA
VEPADTYEVSAAQRYTGHEFTEHRRLTYPNRDVTAKFGGCQDDRQREDDRRNRIRVSACQFVRLRERDRYEGRDEEEREGKRSN